MRKVNLTVKARIMVPIIVTYTVVTNADEGVEMERLARAALRGPDPSGATIEDSSFEVAVEDADPTMEDLNDQIGEYIKDEDSLVPKYLSHEVTDSR